MDETGEHGGKVRFGFSRPSRLSHLLVPMLAAVGLVGLVATFAVEMGSFRRAVEEWAARDLSARTELAAANLREPLRTGDFRSLYAFGSACESEGLQLTVFSAGGGVFYDSHKQGTAVGDVVYAIAKSGEFSVRLGLSCERVLAPFRRARFGFVLAALAGGAGMLLVFFFTYRQHVRIRELARLEKFRREFVADVSHELKTPLTGILGAVDLLGEMGEKAESGEKKLITLISREAKRLDSLAQGILDLARLERADEAVHKTETDLGELVCDVVESLRPQAEARGIGIEVKELGEGEQWMVSCDAQLVCRAVLNLVGNAIRHSESKDVVVTLERVGREVRIVVEDHGKGIPQEEAKRVFERFHRVDPARSAETGGAGLGLAIVRRIARLHGGDVTLTAAVPSGCRFAISLPA